MNNHRQNERTTDTAIVALNKRIGQIARTDFPTAMRAVGRSIIDYTKSTHEYQNQTGQLEDSHDFVVIEPGGSESISIDTRNGTTELHLSSPPNQISLFLFTRKQYGLWVEIVHGYAVLIQGFLKLRHEFTKMLGSAFKSRLIR